MSLRFTTAGIARPRSAATAGPIRDDRGRVSYDKPEGVPGDCADGTGPALHQGGTCSSCRAPARTAGLGELRQYRSVVQPTLAWHFLAGRNTRPLS